MNANIIYTIFFFILPIRKSALLPLKIKMKESTVSPTVLFFMPFSHFLPSSSQQSHAIRPSGGSRPPLPPPLPASPPPVRPCVMRHGSIGKAGRKNQKKWRPFERLKSGAQHQISRHSELGKHQAFLANNAGVCRKTSIFSTFFPAFHRAMRITQGQAAARRPLYSHNSSVNRANSCKFNASPRIVSGQPQAVIAASISSFEKCSSSEFFSPFASVFRL